MPGPATTSYPEFNPTSKALKAQSRRAFAEPADWLKELAEPLDQGPPATDLLQKFASEGLTGIGVPQEFGGDGGSWADAVESIAELAEQSLTASFVLWSHRTYIECVVRSNNPVLRARELPTLLAGEWAGAVGMSNAMKFVCGFEPLEVMAKPAEQESGLAWRVNGVLPWVTNLRAGGFSVAAAAQPAAPGPVPVFAFRSDMPGVCRGQDLALMGLRGSDVAEIQLAEVPVGVENRLHDNLTVWLPQVRPQFLGFQCGMSIGLARASIAAAREHAGRRAVLQWPLTELHRDLESDAGRLLSGLQRGIFSSDPAALFRLRIALARHVQQALYLELQAWGGQAYLEGKAPGFARRWRESAFIPVITPSLAQLEMQLSLLKQ
ncbi:acyl-CoA dehydrogenase family protein [Comamonas guangdongensis]|uniref:Acyl-CoA dehydrogenase family protein n=1 Tax=Comamonas guangdongensis TaxID=510515 RepID=A0ABV3ZT14_9BURK